MRLPWFCWPSKLAMFTSLFGAIASSGTLELKPGCSPQSWSREPSCDCCTTPQQRACLRRRALLSGPTFRPHGQRDAHQLGLLEPVPCPGSRHRPHDLVVIPPVDLSHWHLVLLHVSLIRCEVGSQLGVPRVVVAGDKLWQHVHVPGPVACVR